MPADTATPLLFDVAPFEQGAPLPHSRPAPPRKTNGGIPPANPWPLADGLTVVLFAGLGGACAGLEDAGRPVHIAINHDAVAIAAHQALHPHTRHIQGDIVEVDPLSVTRGQHVSICWASPDCKDHSSAKGGAPRSPRVRSLPWQVVRWAAKTRPDVIYVENVREIRGWSSLIAKRDKTTGRVVKLDKTIAAPGERVPVHDQILVRDKRCLGKTYRRWVASLEALGYSFEYRDMCCADFGIPTTRRRFFAILRRKGAIHWPEVTHAPASQAAAKGLLPWEPMAGLLDWSLPLKSIFGRKQPLAKASQSRLAAGFKRYVLETKTPFIVHLTHQGKRGVHDIGSPLPTVTAAHRGELALAVPRIVPVCHPADGQSGASLHQGGTQQPAGGGDTAITAAFITRYHGEKRSGEGRGLLPTSPLPVQTTENRFGVVGVRLEELRRSPIGQTVPDQETPEARTDQGPDPATLAAPAMVAWLPQHNTGVVGHPPTSPLSTLTTIGTQQQIAAAYVVEYRGTSRDGQPLTDPAPTICTGGNRGGSHTGVVAVSLVGAGDPPAVSFLDPEHYAGALRVAEFMRAHGWTGGDLVTLTIDGKLYVVVDIGMRMLAPFEAAAAHELRLPETIEIDGKRRPLNKTEAMRLIGNSVPRRMARLLVEANSPAVLFQQGATAGRYAAAGARSP